MTNRHHAPDALAELILALQGLPGVGQRSAQRMAFYLLQHHRTGAKALAHALVRAVETVHHCQWCHSFATDTFCETCLDPTRDRRQLCVVETAADQMAVERTGAFQGHYFVLQGKISPLDGVMPQDIGVQHLIHRITDSQKAQDGLPIQEVILATNFTIEGETTAHILTQMITQLGVQVTRLARGVPIGSELEYVDLGTIAHALVDRR